MEVRDKDYKGPMTLPIELSECDKTNIVKFYLKGTSTPIVNFNFNDLTYYAQVFLRKT